MTVYVPHYAMSGGTLIALAAEWGSINHGIPFGVYTYHYDALSQDLVILGVPFFQGDVSQEADVEEAVRRGLALLALPLNAPLGLKLLYRTVDAIWYAAGDTSADFNFYTKRATLAGVFSSTLFYWLNDRSEGNTATWEFLDRRIDDVMRFEKFKSQFGKKAAATR